MIIKQDILVFSAKVLNSSYNNFHHFISLICKIGIIYPISR